MNRISFGAAVLLLLLGGLNIAQSPNTSCDFSEYNYFWMDHFLPLGFLLQVKPVYPAAARAVKASGPVQIDIIVDNKGKVRDACAVSGHPLLRAAAIKAAKDTKFKRNFGLSLPQSPRLKFIKSELFFNFTLP
jgi:TonB family protein